MTAEGFDRRRKYTLTNKFSRRDTLIGELATRQSSLLEIDHLTVRYSANAPVLSDATLRMARGEVAGLVGASGSGKSTLALAALGLLPAGAIASGRISWEGRSLLDASEAELRRVRGAGLALISQEPKAALNPVLRCGRQVAEVVRAHRQISWSECRREAALMLEAVGLQASAGEAYPHQLSIAATITLQ